MLLFHISRAAALIVLLLACAAAQAADGVILFDANGGRVSGPPAPESSDGIAFARLALKTQQRILWDATSVGIAAPAAAVGWQVQDGVLAWLDDGTRTDSLAALPLELSSDVMAQGIARYDELWVDFAAVPAIAPCTVQVALTLDGPGRGAPVSARSGPAFSPRVLRSINPLKASWTQKDAWYVAGRMLGAHFDEGWRYSTFGPWAVLQRRLHMATEGVEAVDLAFAPGQRVHQVNVRIGHGGVLGRSEILEFGNFAPDSTLSDGTSGVRLKLREALDNRGAQLRREASEDLRGMQIEEIVVFMAGDARAAVESGFLRRLDIVGEAVPVADGEATAARTMTLPSKLVGFVADNQRLVVDLRPLRSHEPVRLRHARLQVIPGLSAVCAVRPLAAQLVKPYDDEVPVFAWRLGETDKRGADPVATHEVPGEVFWRERLAYLPMNALMSPAAESGSAEFIVRVKGTRDPQVESLPPLRRAGTGYRVETAEGRLLRAERGRLIASNGAVAAFEGPMPAVTPVGTGALWEGRFHAFDIYVPVAKTLPDSAWLLFGTGDGAERIGRLTLTLEAHDGRNYVRALAPNRAVRLPAGVSLRSIRVHGVMAPGAASAMLRVEAISIFVPRRVSVAEAFTSKAPTPVSSSPVPEFSGKVQLLRASPSGQITALTPAGGLQFSTRLNPPLSLLRGIRLKYAFPQELLDALPCPVGIRINTSSRPLDRRICFDAPAGEVFISLSELAPDEALGDVRSIDWDISGSTAAAGIELSPVIEGWTMASAADELRSAPLFETRRGRIYASALPELPRLDAHSRFMRVPLDARAVWRAWRASEVFTPRSSDWFAIEALEAVPAVVPATGAITPLPVASPAPLTGRTLIWLAIAAVLAAAWLAVRRWRLPIAGAAGRFSHALGHRAGRWAARFGPLATLSIAAAVLWSGARIGEDFAAAMLSVSAAVLVVGAYLQSKRAHASLGAEARARVAMALGAIAAGCVVWALGRHGVGIEAAWAMLPAAAVAYVLAASTLRTGTYLWRHPELIAFVVSCCVAAALYAYGARSPKPGENYAFTFAGVAVVVAWLAAAAFMRAWAHAAFPAAASRIYTSPAGVYFCGALVTLALAATALVLKVQLVLEQLATVLYYFMIVALARQAWAMRRRRDSGGANGSSRPGA